MNGLDNDEFKHYSGGTYVSLMKGAIDRADAMIVGDPEVNREIMDYAKASGKPILEYQDSEDYYEAYNEFYDKIIGED
jgi:starch synthase